MISMDRFRKYKTPLCGTLAFLLAISVASVCPAYFPSGRGIRGPVYHYGYGPSCGPNVPTTRTMQNNLWQSQQWRGEYPVCQPLYAPNFGHFQTHWHRFPGEDCCDDGPTLGVRPF